MLIALLVNITFVMWLAFALDETGLRWGIKILLCGEVCLNCLNVRFQVYTAGVNSYGQHHKILYLFARTVVGLLKGAVRDEC